SLLGTNLDKALPYASRIGYTGTPIDKTEKVFGDYIDKYTMGQSIEDGVTLEIVYTGRTHNAEVSDQTGMDAAFADVFSEYNLQERLQILGYGSRDAYLEAHPTIAAKARDMVQHYLQWIFPNGYKAQVVATSREAAVRYKEHLDAALAEEIAKLEQANPHQLNLDRLSRLKTDVVISSSHNDLPHLKQYSNSTRHDTTIKSFKLPFDARDEGITGDVGIVIVNNMLLTGFDAPVEQVMYLDRVIKAHNLLQAVARVNRVGGANKDKGFVVDYVGIGHHLKRAIDNYDEREQQEIEETLSFPEEEIRQLEDDHRAILALLKQNGLTDLNDQDAFFDLFYDEDVRFEFMLAFKKLTRSLNLVYPAKEALNYMRDYQSLTAVNVLAGQHFRDERLSMRGIPPKLRALTDQYLQSRGIDEKVKPISILDEDFESHVQKHQRVKTKAAAIEHALRHHIDIDLADDPELQASFSEALRAILEEFKDNWDKIYQELEKLRQKVREAENEPTYGLDRKKQLPLFRMFKRECFGEAALTDDMVSQMVALTQQVFTVVEQELQLTSFWESIPARKKLREEIQKVLLSPDFYQIPNLMDNREQIISRVMEIAEKNNDRIV
ncbi:MAG: UvrB domain 3-containing protein, partial [Microcystis aeruginosa]